MYSQYDADGDINMKEADATYSETCVDVALQVFNTAELLENIMLHLPQKDILLSQRVATKWRDVVKDSVKLRRALFLEPSADPEMVAVVCKECLDEDDEIDIESDYISSKLLCRLPYQPMRREQLPPDSWYGPVRLGNWLLLHHGERHTKRSMVQYTGDHGYRDFAQRIGIRGQSDFIAKLLDDPAAATYSCHSMFLTQPPTSRVEVTLRSPPKCVPKEKCCACKKEMVEPTQIELCRNWGCLTCLVLGFADYPDACPGCGSVTCEKYGDGGLGRTPVEDYHVLTVVDDAGVRVSSILATIRRWFFETQLPHPVPERALADSLCIKIPGECEWDLAEFFLDDKSWDKMVTVSMEHEAREKSSSAEARGKQVPCEHTQWWT